MRHANISIFIPHLGCPFNCIFCDQYKITGSDSCVTPDDVYATLCRARERGLSSKDTQIAFFGGSFTAIDRELMVRFLSVAYEFIKDGSFDSIRISTRPDCIDSEVLEILKCYGVKTVELGVQSLDDGVLDAACRGHSAKQSLEAVKLIQSMGLEAGMQMMCGLPGDTRFKDIETAKKIIDTGCKQVRIYPVCVIEGTHLADMYKRGEYIPLTVDEAVDTCAILCDMFEKAGVTVLKCGLHTDSGSIAGPFHPALGELVRSQMFYNKITREFERGAALEILCSNRFISVAKGNKGKNLPLFEKAGLNVTITLDKTLENGYKVKRLG